MLLSPDIVVGFWQDKFDRLITLDAASAQMTNSLLLLKTIPRHLVWTVHQTYVRCKMSMLKTATAEPGLLAGPPSKASARHTAANTAASLRRPSQGYAKKAARACSHYFGSKEISKERSVRNAHWPQCPGFLDAKPSHSSR